VGNPLHDIEPSVLILGLVLIRIVNEMGATLRQRDFAGENFVVAIKECINLREIRPSAGRRRWRP
jgi:hypothetical protein